MSESLAYNWSTGVSGNVKTWDLHGIHRDYGCVMKISGERYRVYLGERYIGSYDTLSEAKDVLLTKAKLKVMGRTHLKAGLGRR